MAFFSTLSSFVEGARDQLDELISAIADDTPPPRTLDAPPSRRVVPSDLDPSVSHDTFVFVARLLDEPVQARALFLSYANVLTQRRHQQQEQQEQQHAAARDKFALTREQNLHARSIIAALPALDRLRFELCPSNMQDHRFWEVYFSLVADKDLVAAPKVSPSKVDAPQPEPSPRASPTTSSKRATLQANSATKEHVPSAEDSHKGVKRERDAIDDVDAETRRLLASGTEGLSEDLAVVSRFLASGAHHTMQFAGRILGDAAAATLDTRETTSAAAATAAALELGSKRGRFASEEPGAEARSLASTQSEGLSVASVEDPELREWAAVSPRRLHKVNAPLSDDEAEAFELL